MRRYIFDAHQLHLDQIEQLLRDLIHAPPGGGPESLPSTPEQDSAAERAKALRRERDETDDPVRRRELDQLIEETLGEVRPDLEDLVRSQHPSLTAVDPDHNLYRVTIAGREYYGTLEALLDFRGPSDAVQRLGNQIFTRDMVEGDTTQHATGGLAGTSSQGRASPYPGDVDLGETIRIDATSATAASRLLARSIQQTVARATVPRGDGRPPVVFLGASFGTYPQGHPAAGRRISWTPADIERGAIVWLENGQEHRYTMAEALVSPGDRAVNTHWRGPIDNRGTYGEITKVLTYEAFQRDTGERLFGTPRIGQAFQMVSFGVPMIHDTDRAELLTALIPQIREKFEHGEYLKAVKRAYTVARMLNDVPALNDLAPLMAGPQAELLQVTEHLDRFAQEIVSPDRVGPGSEMLSQQEAKALAEDLVGRVRQVNVVQGERLAQGLRDAGNDVRDNPAFFAVCESVVGELEKAAAENHEYARQVEETLFMHGYLDGSP